ncbi:bifunctional RNase H/acid phosphatase [Gephyromycinifex aptenodytis]|uniref:bifunctional RNase H/acid phosphatase n=1 Tax=Gephyromycinifex aptenodytis TaxID=2716227 RepID=UPI001445FAE1|nr:bifunctional RNase H/acid phosphatase [Gephyromycinifex aptenodytis]
MSPRRLIVEADGGSRGNPGVAGYGALVRDETGRAVRELAAPLGKASNNVAEYTGLIVGLQAAREFADGQVVEVDVRLDSKLLVEQMSGRWKIKHADMARLAQQAREIVAELRQAGGSVSFTWIPRAQNKDADALSNEGMDGHHVDRRPEQSPSPGAEDEADEASELVPAPQPLPRGKRSPDMGEAMRIVLVRHGVTDFTTAGRLDGRGGRNPELSAEGLRQARAVGAGLRAFLGDTVSDARVITSQLARAAQTGAAIGAVIGLRPSVDPDWDEIDFGDWDGKLVSELMTSHGADLARLREDANFRAPGGESHADLRLRVQAAFDRLITDASGAAETIIVVTHRSPIGEVLAQVLGMAPVGTWRLGISPASITSIRRWNDGEMLVEFVNDTAHLR